MAKERPPVSILQIVCLAIGIFTGIIVVKMVLGLDGIVGGALGGGLGAVIGMLLFGILNRGK